MSNAEKLLERMRRKLDGWGNEDFCRLYQGFGFDKIEGKKHTLFTHPKLPLVQATVARHNNLAKGYASDAVKYIDQLKQLLAQEKEEGGNEKQ